MGRFIKGDAAIEHLKARGTLWCREDSGRHLSYWSFSDGFFTETHVRSGKSGATRKGFNAGHLREVRTEPPAKPNCGLPQEPVMVLTRGMKEDEVRDLHRQLIASKPPRTYAVGDIVTGDEAYRLVELGAVVQRDAWEDDACVFCKPDPVRMNAPWTVHSNRDQEFTVSHTRRTLWNPDADEWRIVEPPKTITAEEARKVVDSGGAVASTLVAPEDEWVDAAMDHDPRTISGGEWVVRRAAPTKSSVLTTEEEWALRRAEEGQALNQHEQNMLVKALRRLEKELSNGAK